MLLLLLFLLLRGMNSVVSINTSLTLFCYHLIICLLVFSFPSNQTEFISFIHYHAAAFYEIDYTDGEGSTIRNMPEGFVVDPRTAFPNMGIHAWKVSDDPDDVSTWSEPRLWMGSYDKDIAYLEPMFPLEFVTGDEDNTWEITPTYVEQTIPSLPSKIGMYYNAETGILTNYLEGKSEVCIIGTIDCDSIDTKNECNKKFGCLWQRKKKKNNCGHAKTNTECKKYRNKEKCKKRGCVWNKKADDDKCKSRWEKL